MRRTKIVCTIGPATESPEMIESLIKAGMNVARLNFSHGTHEAHLVKINNIRRISKALGRNVGILQDLPGPKIRIGPIANPPVQLEPGNEFIFTTRDVPGNAKEVNLPYPELVRQVKARVNGRSRGGQMIYVDDAKLEFKVVSATDTDIITKVVIGGELSSHKGFTLPGATYDASGVTEKDLQDLRFGLEHGVDWVAASFVRSADDILPLKKVMREVGKRVPVVAKIERREAVKNIVEIIEAFDAVMVARGDLGIELAIDEVPVIQKTIIKHCNRLGKPVITATQMLDSMISNARPTRAEVTDVANAIIDGTDATMLSGETAIGAYPVEAVRMMDAIARRIEKSVEYRSCCARRIDYPAHDVTEAIGEAATKLASDLNLPAIITCTFGGTTARLVAKYRPQARIIAAASNEETARRLSLSWGVDAIYVEMAKDTDALIENAVEASLDAKLVKKGDTVLMIAGVPVGVPGNTSLIRVLKV
ncbi:MAG: pyruvate kinase [Armatimonadetes bacterium]|nr:pyruvate kinase [Armatimonadota bacterium]